MILILRMVLEKLYKEGMSVSFISSNFVVFDSIAAISFVTAFKELKIA